MGQRAQQKCRWNLPAALPHSLVGETEDVFLSSLSVPTAEDFLKAGNLLIPKLVGIEGF